MGQYKDHMRLRLQSLDNMDDTDAMFADFFGC